MFQWHKKAAQTTFAQYSCAFPKKTAGNGMDFALLLSKPPYLTLLLYTFMQKIVR
jgi:hypothetical protein